MQAGSSNCSSVLRQLSLSRVPNSWSNGSPISQRQEEDEEEKNSLARQGWEWEWEWECEMKERKKVAVVVDGSPEAKIAMLWALSYLVNKVDTLILLHVFDTTSVCKCKPDVTRLYLRGCYLLNSMRALCRSRRPQVEVEGVMIQGDKAKTIVSYSKRLKVSLLVLGQRKPSLLRRFFRSKRQEVMDFCISNAECLTLGVRKQSSSVGGYIINSRWHRDFWLLA